MPQGVVFLLTFCLSFFTSFSFFFMDAFTVYSKYAGGGENPTAQHFRGKWVLSLLKSKARQTTAKVLKSLHVKWNEQFCP